MEHILDSAVHGCVYLKGCPEKTKKTQSHPSIYHKIHVADLLPRLHQGFIDGDRHGDLVECVEKSHQFVSFKVWLAKHNFHSCSETICLHLAEQPTLLTLNTVHNSTDIVDIPLVTVKEWLS